MEVLGYGFPNYGNTCYLNSIIQALAHTTTFVRYIVNEVYLENYENKNDVIEILKNIYNNIWIECDSPDKIQQNINGLIRDLKRKLEDTNKFFRGFDQEDAGEAFTYLIDAVHKNLTYNAVEDEIITIKSPDDKYQKLIRQSQQEWFEHFKNDYSDLLGIFYGQLKSTTINIATKEISNKFDAFNYLNLPIPLSGSKHTIYDCLDLYTEQEDIDSRISKKITFFKLPEILVIGFNRFGNGLKKIGDFIECPTSIDLSKYITTRGLSNKYDLYATVNHMGGMFGGHYTCNARKQGQWFCYNDIRVSKIADSEVNTSANYLMFYKRV
jgi:ubiquitin C-terminal hydrolase